MLTQVKEWLGSAYELAVGDVAPKLRHRLGAFAPLPLNPVVPIRQTADGLATEVDSFWSAHPVNAIRFASAAGSLDYLDWRFRHYPLFRELSGLYGDHDGQLVLDYGCGPGNDLVGFLVHSKARRIIGMDVSTPALRLASHRLGLHRAHGLDRVELLRISDGEARIPLPDRSVDHVNCQGVLMSTTDPGGVLRELARVLAVGSSATVMVYNHDSVWRHLYVAYQLQIRKGRYPGLTLDEAFSKTTDGEDCPIVRSYTPEQFSALCLESGFSTATFAGGYFSRLELRCLVRDEQRALADSRFPADSRAFIEGLERDLRGYPLHRGLYAGVGGVYRLTI